MQPWKMSLYFLLHAVDANELCLKNGLHSGAVGLKNNSVMSPLP
jgi:hypothetical protein